MILDTKKIAHRTFSAIALYSLFAYLFAHLSYMYMNTVTGLVFEYITYYLSKITEFAVPLVIATVSLVVYVTNGAKSAVKCAFIGSFGRVLFTLPYYYIVFIFNYGYDSLESLILSVIAAVGIVTFTVGGAFFEICLAWWIVRRLCRRTERNFDMKASIIKSLEENQSRADFTYGANRIILWFAIFRFIRNLISEIIDTVLFFLDYGLDYTALEIFSIMGGYILLFALIAVSYLIGVWVKGLVIRTTVEEDEE